MSLLFQELEIFAQLFDSDVGVFSGVMPLFKAFHVFAYPAFGDPGYIVYAVVLKVALQMLQHIAVFPDGFPAVPAVFEMIEKFVDVEHSSPSFSKK